MSSKPTEQASSNRDGAGTSESTNTGGGEKELVPGAVLDHGRYRLLSQVGSDVRCDAELWRAKDGVLGRDVALTILLGDRSDSGAAARARRTLERAMHASTFNHVGVARVLDVVTPAPDDPGGFLGAVIAEWTHGTDLVDLVAEGPLPPGTAARLSQPLAAAVEAAHHAGLVLGTDHPQRIRVTNEGEIRMAFPGPLASATSSDDVRGLGAVLYLLLTGRWSLADGPEGVPTAPQGPDGTIVAPRTLRPTVPMELSTVAVRALGSPDLSGTTGGVRTGAAVLRVLEQHASHEASTSVMQAVPASGGEPRDNEVWRTEDPKPDKTTRKKLFISVGVLGAATLLVVGWVAAGVIGIFAGPASTSGPSVVVQEDGDNHNPGQGGQPPPPPPEPVGASEATSFNPYGEADSPSRAPNLIDGDPATYWTTFDYFQQLGPDGIAEGTGVVLSLEQASNLREVVVNSAMPGVRVEIRSTDSTSPDIEASPVIGSADLTEGDNVIPIQPTEPTDHIIVWVTQLNEGGEGNFRATLNEVTVRGTAP